VSCEYGPPRSRNACDGLAVGGGIGTGVAAAAVIVGGAVENVITASAEDGVMPRPAAESVAAI
jgi:hypothetical protein